MCGIAGAIGALRPTDVEACGAMSRRLRHRGPDDEGSWNWQVGQPFGAVLCHRRLSIIDLRSIAAEPMVSAATGTTLVFNGEIYNFRDLRAELEAAGARFVTNGDTEVILHGYDRWGVDVFARLRGMFALVIVDPRNRQAVMARDGYGIKPLYFAEFPGAEGRPALAFASEGRALVEAGFAERRTDATRVGRYLWNGFMPGPDTIWTQVREVPRGCYAVLDEQHGTPHFERFWTIGSSFEAGRAVDAEEASSLVAEAVKRHLIADVPRVVFLSGGVDSTAVAAAAARAEPDGLHTLSVAFAEADADERHFASVAAAAIGSEHHVVELSAGSILDDLQQALAALDQPSFDGINSWFVSREAARLGFKVALSGAGGDELVGGYTSFRRALRVQSAMRLPGSKPLTSVAGHVMQQLRPGSKAGQLGRAFGALEQMYQTQYALFSTGTLQRLLIAGPLSPWGLDEQRAAELAAEIAPLSTLQAVTALESEMFLGDRLLRDMDSVSMAHSIELRVPLVDTVLAGGLGGMSDSDRYLPIGEKRLLRRQSESVLPDSFFARPKRGFEFPMDSWMRGPLRPLIEGKLLDSDQCTAMGLRADQVAGLWQRFLDRPGEIYWTRPWALFSLLQWASANGVTCA